MRTALFYLIACAAMLPLWASGGVPIATCHIAYTWMAPHSNAPAKTTQAKDLKLTRDQIAKLPHFKDAKIMLNDTGEVAAPVFMGEIVCETDKEVITYRGTFVDPFFRDTFVKRSEVLVLLPTLIPPRAMASLPPASTLPPGLECRWGGGNSIDSSLPGQSFGVVLQLFDRHTQWLRARFDGTCARKSKAWNGATTTQDMQDTDVVFPPNNSITAVHMAYAPFRF